MQCKNQNVSNMNMNMFGPDEMHAFLFVWLWREISLHDAHISTRRCRRHIWQCISAAHMHSQRFTYIFFLVFVYVIVYVNWRLAVQLSRTVSYICTCIIWYSYCKAGVENHLYVVYRFLFLCILYLHFFFMIDFKCKQQIPSSEFSARSL